MEIKTRANDVADVAFLKRMMIGLVAGTTLCASGLLVSAYEVAQEQLGTFAAEVNVSSK